MAAPMGKSKSTSAFNVAQYRGLIDTVEGVKDHVHKERQKARENEQLFKETLRAREEEAQSIQKELSVQLRCAGRSYQSLLAANRDLAEDLRKVEALREDENETARKEIKSLKSQLVKVVIPWKEEVAKREIKIETLQEANVDLDKRWKEAEAKLPVVEERMKEEIRVREEKSESILKEVEACKQLLEAEQETHKSRLKEVSETLTRERVELEQQLQDQRKEKEQERRGLEKRIRELEREIKTLEKQLAAVDHTPYLKQIESKDKGYKRLVKDFEMKLDACTKREEKAREGFEKVIQRLDEQLQKSEVEFERRIAPYKDMVEVRDNKIVQLEDIIEDMKEKQAAVLVKHDAEMQEVRKELTSAKEGLDIQYKELYQAKRQLQSMEEYENRPENPKKLMEKMERDLEEVTAECKEMIAQKDKEMEEKTEMVTRLQRRIVEMGEATDAIDKTWDSRVQRKEEGYLQLSAELEFAKGQILEERENTRLANETIKKRDAEIERLVKVHTEELRVRFEDRQVLEREIHALQEDFDREVCRIEAEKYLVEEKLDLVESRAEQRVADIGIELVRKDKQIRQMHDELDEVRQMFEQARVSWEEKERELEGFLRNRDRQIGNLKNEIEFLNDAWELKYNKLMALFERAQKKYEDLLGPGGIREAQRRVVDLKMEVDLLRKEILDLKETLKKQKRRIRDLELDMDGQMKETADILTEKERGIAEMVGDYAKLQALFRSEVDLKEKLLAEKDMERQEMKNAFQARIAQLEQLVEAMRYTDREDLVEKIAKLKQGMSRKNVEMEELEEHYEELLKIKDVQIKDLVKDLDAVRVEVDQAKLDGEGAVQKVKDMWQLMHTKALIEKGEAEEKLKQSLDEVERLERELAKATGQKDKIVEDPEKAELRAKIKEMEEQMVTIEAGKTHIVEENRDLMAQLEEVEPARQAMKAEYEEALRLKDKLMEVMKKEHEELKAVLVLEMETAKESCRVIEAQVRALPGPFDSEAVEMKNKYAQMQAGMLKIGMENSQIREELEELQRLKEEEIEELKKGLDLATFLLKQVASLGALKDLSKAKVEEMEGVLGVDLNGDGKVGKR
mmetsp:Transcript_65262/g.155923  ORF Transcript_65262/g.155923 Transcript_65262/m.155923 type:complete len:1082 (-) Transcript_65262:108-3353(-)